MPLKQKQGIPRIPYQPGTVHLDRCCGTRGTADSVLSDNKIFLQMNLSQLLKDLLKFFVILG